ncbi:MAG: Rrf2 family transcriptional regulator [Candidatus Parcubacteria bacterium]|nr:Rrf2 family transcriptional regulator [Candidatus Parcubacteria bacterium]
MMFSTKSEYGLRALVNLSKNQGNVPYSLAKIAKEEKISLAYLERLFAKLKRAKIVVSVKGVNGGYKLAKPALRISVKDILTALEGSLAPYVCAGIGGLCAKKGCDCQSKIVWQKLDQGISKTLNSIKLSDLIK